MVSVVADGRAGRARRAAREGRGRLVVALRSWPRARRALTSQPALLTGLVVVAALYTVCAVVVPTWFPLATVTVWILLGGFFLRLRYLLAYFAVLAAAATTAVLLRTGPALSPGVVLALVAVGLLVLAYARSRERVGLQGALGDSMLVDLRARLATQGTLPALGPGWGAENLLRAAYGDAFSGDFFVTALSADRTCLEVVLVDVSGKGQPAGSRALMLSGAFGGLLGALPSEQFLPAANAYLLRQHWVEGFATAVHLTLDLTSGAFRIACAGHPPPMRFRHGAGRWDLVDGAHGPLLGVVPQPAFPGHEGVLDRGDGLLLYTDGLVENASRDIRQGTDRLLGAAARAVSGGFTGAAAHILAGARAGDGDDRALLLLWRE